jgi:phosphoserine phosphatase RsbU/P
MRLRTLLFGSMFVILAAVIGIVTAGLSLWIDKDAESGLSAGLEQAQSTLHEFQNLRQALLRAQARVIAEEPRLKAVAATEQVDHETVLGVAQELRQAIQSDLFIVTDARGRLLADVADPEAVGFDMSTVQLIGETLANGQAVGIMQEGELLYEVQGRNLNFGATLVGALLVGFRLDDRRMGGDARQGDTVAMLLLDGKLIASSAKDEAERQLLAEAIAPALDQPNISVKVHKGDRAYVAMASGYPGYGGEGKLQYVVARSLDRALASSRQLRNALIVVLVVGGLIVALLAVYLSRRISRPIDKLVEVTQRITSGELSAKAEVEGSLELRELATAMNAMVSEIARSREDLVRGERVEQDMRVASRIQSALLPSNLDADGIDVSAGLKSVVGTDYYDFIPVHDGAWVSLGDVSGQGVTATLLILIAQSIVAAITRLEPDLTPKDVVCLLNRIVFDNVRSRLGESAHLALTLMRYENDGTLIIAGAHQDLVLYRAKTRRCELVATRGTWVGAMPEIAQFTNDFVCRLEEDDVIVAYSDGVVNALDASDQQFGIDRVISVLEKVGQGSAEQIRDGLMQAIGSFQNQQSDDTTLVVLKRRVELMPELIDDLVPV